MIALLTVVVLAVLAGATTWILQQRRKQAQAEQNLHAIQLALERWSVDVYSSSIEPMPYNPYPAQLEQVIGQPYFAALPVNPYSKPGEMIRNVPVISPGCGDFTYIPLRTTLHFVDGTSFADTGAYYLLLWGRRRSAFSPNSEILTARQDLPLVLCLDSAVSKRTSKWPKHYLGREIESISMQSLDEALAEAGLTAQP